MAGNSDRGIMLSPVNRAARGGDGRPHWCSVARSREGFGGALLGDSTQNFQFRLCCPANSSPNSPVVLASGAAMPSKRGEDHRTNGKEKGTTLCVLWLWPGKNLAQGLPSIPEDLESRTNW